MANIQITFPDGTSREFPQGVTAQEVAQSIGPRLAAEALAAKHGDRLVDLSTSDAGHDALDQMPVLRIVEPTES